MSRPSAAEPPAGRCIILDGGTGRELMRLGAPFRVPEWSALALLEAPEFVTRVHERYIDAGADVVTTNSYAVVPFHIGAARFATDGPQLAALAGRLARESADRASRPVWVAGSLPPVCGSYRPDLFDPAVAAPVLRELRHALQPCVDLWLAETVGSIAEIILLRDILAGSALPWWVSFTLEDEHARPMDARLRSGESVGEASAYAAQLGASAVLFNCCQPEVIGAALVAARHALKTATPDSAQQVRLGAYANAFAPQSQQAAANEELSELRQDLGPAEYFAWAERWVASGAQIVGGCCGVGPEHIALLRQALAGKADQRAS